MVQERGLLSLAYMAVGAAISVVGAGDLRLQSSVLSGPVTVSGTLTAKSSTFNSGVTVTGMLIAQSSTFSSGLNVDNAGPATLVGTMIEQSVGVTGDTQLSLSGCTLAASARLTARGGGSLSLASMAVPAAVLTRTTGALSGMDSTLRLDAITVPEVPEVAGGSKTANPPGFGTQHTGTFTVSSGPCTVSEGGRCVGRPAGYGQSEDCAITVVGGGGVLGACAVFDLNTGYGNADHVTLPGGATYRGSECPVGAALAPGDAIGWTSNGDSQGSVCPTGCPDNGCVAKGTCGLPASGFGTGGGWELCFA